jgi:Protein of unknown function (DUF4058)
MPSLFPGMDPYLEGSEWRSVHTHLSVEIARYLAPKLRPKYVVRTEKNYILASPDPENTAASALSRRSPDVSIVRSDRPARSGSDGAALAEAPLHLAVIMPEEVPQVTIEIHDVAERSLVTAIEVLSATNKKGEGREEYLAKRRRLLHSRAHLMEIDLLRSGERLPMADPLPASPYFVILSRAGQRPMAEVWPIELRMPLPSVPIPLLEGDADVELDLQQVMTTMYDSFGYDLDLDYTKPPEVPLESGDAAWAGSILDEAGIAKKR